VKFFDLGHPFFKPLFVRVSVTLVAFCWGVFEIMTGEPFWAILFLAVAVWCAYSFFLSPTGDDPER